MKNLFTAIAVIILISGIVFAGDNGTRNLSGHDYLPLKEGYKWVYRLNLDLGLGGAIPGAPLMPEMELTLKVTGKEKVGNINCFILDASISFGEGIIIPPGGDTQTKLYLASTREGIKLYKAGDKSLDDKPTLLLKYPLRKGDEWKALMPSFQAVEGEELKLKVDSEEEIETPLGKFKCLKVTGDKYNTTIWFAKGNGIIKYSASYEGISTSFELKSFEKGSKKDKK